MDTTRVEIAGKQLDQLVNSITQNSNALSAGQVALIAATIGALAAILSQLVIFLLTRLKERENLRKEIIADERRIAYLLTEYYKELVMHKVHKQYWYKTSELHKPGTEDSIDSHNRHFISNQKGFETITRIRVVTSEYFKIVTLFTNLTGQNEIITQALTEIKSFKPRKASDFVEIQTYGELLQAQLKEEEALNEVYLYFSYCFDKINIEMTTKM